MLISNYITPILFTDNNGNFPINEGQVNFIAILTIFAIQVFMGPEMMVVSIACGLISVASQLTSNGFLNGDDLGSTLTGAYIGGSLTPLGMAGPFYAGVFNAFYNQLQYSFDNNLSDYDYRRFFIEAGAYVVANYFAASINKGVLLTGVSYYAIDAVTYFIVDYTNMVLDSLRED